jgi:ubiquinone/menaquinone biosynthesis C-methylase UbiE
MSAPEQPTEAERIRQEYSRRAREVPHDFYAISKPANLFIHLQRTRAVLAAMARSAVLPLSDKRLLEIGCGTGGWLVDFESWGAARGNLAGLDLLPDRVAVAQARLGAQRDPDGRDLSPGADIRQGDASHLPWPDGSFVLVLQSVVFSSILDPEMRCAVASEMTRVLKPGGVVLWYDFFVDNPRNPNVRGVRKREMLALFPGFKVETLRRITLAPPIARRLVPITWIGALMLEKLVLLNTHRLGVLRKPALGE